MTARAHQGHAAALDARRIGDLLCRELRQARLAAGISLATAARNAGMSAAQLGRIERGELHDLTLEQLFRAAVPVGLRASARLQPGGSPVRDRGHLALFARLEALLAPPLVLRREIPLPIEGDLRAWDGLLVSGRDRAFTELETRLLDMQATERRLRQKLRDDARSDTLVLVVLRSAHNRLVLRDHRESMRDLLPLDGHAIRAALRAGHVPPAGGILVL